MPWFESLSDFVTALSPRRQPQDQRSAVQFGPTATPPPRSRRTQPSRNPFTLSSNDTYPSEVAAGGNVDPSSHPEAPHSYVDTFPSQPRSPIAREDPRERTQPYLELDTWADHSPQMVNKDRRADPQDRKDEARLFGGRYTGDAQIGVKITPGQTLPKKPKPGVGLGFSPVDHISRSRNGRMSGPIRAQGKPSQGNSAQSKSKKQTPTAKQPSHLDDAFEESNRPNKRRRQSDPIDLVNDMGATDSIRNRSPHTSPLAPSKIKDKYRLTDIGEFKELETMLSPTRRPRDAHSSSGVSQLERFTGIATQQRRSRVDMLDSISKAKGHTDPPTRSRLLDEIEASTKPVDQSTGSSGTAHRSDPESPDEIQGDVTTDPLPKSWADKIRYMDAHNKKAQIESRSRKRSPTDIRSTDFAGSPQQGPKRTKRSHKYPVKCIPLHTTFFRIGQITKTFMKEENAVLQMTPDALDIPGDLLDGGNSIQVLFKHVNQVFIAENPSCKVRIKLLQGSIEAGQILDIEFPGRPQKIALAKILQDANVNILDKDMKWMDKAFARHEKDLAQFGTPSKNTGCDDSTETPAPVRKVTYTPRRKISDYLQDVNGEFGDESLLEKQRSTKAFSKWADGNIDSKKAPEDKKHHPDTDADADAGVEIPVRPFKTINDPPERETRSSTRRAPKKNNPLEWEDSDKEAAYLRNDVGRDKWKKPLIYPRNGKKKAEVNLDDRDRLRPDEFLNDNLIAFYMRFIQDYLERMNKKVAQRIYFFNSYFFATLTNTARGQRGVNYTGVEKWTRAVDLFSYDYVVVPINENAHWYVAIICNLPSLDLGPADPADPAEAAQTPTHSNETPKSQQVEEIRETPEPERASVLESEATSDTSSKSAAKGRSKESETRKSFSHLSIGNKSGEQQYASDSWPDPDETPTAPTTKFFTPSPQKLTSDQARATKSAAKPEKKTRKGPRLGPDQTSIITFDSLGISRATTVRMLKDYICREAMAKRGIEIDQKIIKGMCARQIPLQPNFSDCGLYLLAYLEKFVQSPDDFVAKTLSRDMDPDVDFPPLGSGLLRRRLRDFLDELYDEQRRANKHKAEPAQALADRTPISFLLGPPQPTQEKAGMEEEIPESQSQKQPKGPEDSEISKGYVAVETKPRKSRRIEDQESEDSSLDQVQMVPLTRPIPKSTPTSKHLNFSKERSARSSPTKEEPVIQVPDSQEEHELPGTPPSRTSKADERVRRSPRGPSRKG
ncbi:hypothetical protein N7508_002517 [Penicillium antarcticum]|uniref:uncharacterized protein n=1 Tax=Penicillium antarcticum TaxID=416450 RepID=UPI00238AB1FA|nr:uncharacterized protein N7508_002517 [Penicillium antarcticum]KAJ5318009.1 hypothetical protein N7508_002517 [Penicillium antarcticum]